MHSLIKTAQHWRLQRTFSGRTDMCQICGKNPKFIENGFQHPYCGRNCARSATGMNPTVCAFRGCRATGRAAFAGFCSDAHGMDAVRCGQMQGCTQCIVQPKSAGELCASCDYRSRALGSHIAELDNEGVAFKSVENHFMGQWQSSDDPAIVDKIYEITTPRDVRTRHNVFRKKLASAGPVQEMRTYHSSQCICDLGIHYPSIGVNDAVLCDHRSCGICTMVKSSFREFAFGVSFNTGRYGPGIYSYLNPARADRFATSCTSSPYRVMIACAIIVETAQSPLSPTSEALIDESIFVANADAITPEYIILYHK